MVEGLDGIIELESDEPPKSGQWVDNCEVIESLTDEEYELGRRLGENIDTDNDDDNGDDTVSHGSGSGDQSSAMRQAQHMKKVMLDCGVPEVSIQLRTGRPSPYGYWDAGFWVADMSHHTVSRYGSNLTPVLGLCTYGRSDLPGPLCNGYGGWDLCYRIITFGYANHPGEGGSYRVPTLNTGSYVIPRDSARRYAWGTEWEGGLSDSDWDKTLKNPRNGKQMSFREFMGRSNMALEIALEIHNGAHMEHKTWTSRKIDRLNYDKDRGIAEKNRYAKPVKKFPKGPTIDLDNIREEFRKANTGEGKLRRRPGIRVMQAAMGVPETGLADKRTVEWWGKFEERQGVEGRPRVPDEVTLEKFGNRHKINVMG